jgi:hypothetical protein
MGVLQNPLGINLTNHMPLTHSVFSATNDSGASTGPVANALLETDNTPLLLTDGTYLLLAA